MKTFKEYYQGDKYMHAAMRTGKNLYGGTDRKHQNNVRKDYNSKCPHVRNLIKGGAQQIKLMGQPLMGTLNVYGLDYEPGVTKGLGNSGAEVKMFEDEEGNQCGMLMKKPMKTK
jgi:hypothetical protein